MKIEAKSIGCGALLFLALAAQVYGDSSQSPVTPPQGPRLIPVTIPVTGSGVVTTDRAVYQRGSSVGIKFVVENSDRKPVRYEFQSAQEFDVSVRDSSGTEVWRWSSGHTYRPATTVLILDPGKSRTFTAVWPGLTTKGIARGGEYTVAAWLTSRDRPAITAGFAVNTDIDPTNSGLPRPNTDSGSVRTFNTSPSVSAFTHLTIK